MGRDSPYHSLPQPGEISTREKEDAMGAYLMMFAAAGAGLPLPIINLVAAIIYYYINKNKSRFIHFHSFQSLLSQFPTTFINWGVVFILVRIFLYNDELTDNHVGYFWMAGVANLLYFIFSLIATVKARKGQMYYFLFFGKYAYHKVFSIENKTLYGGEEDNSKEVNKPPI